jgi:hypothetical protein
MESRAALPITTGMTSFDYLLGGFSLALIAAIYVLVQALSMLLAA